MKKGIDIITILGPTASGKTQLAAHLAYHLKSHIVSADSRQVYKNMNIGTGKDYEDYIVEGQQIPYHLIDIAEAGAHYNLYQYKKDFFKTYQDLKKKNILPILCGGTGMYIDAILSNYKLIKVPKNRTLREQLSPMNIPQLINKLKTLKKLHNTTDTIDRDRLIRAIEIATYYQSTPTKEDNYPNLESLTIGIYYERDTLKKRITQRLQQRLENGMIKEVKDLLNTGLTQEQLTYYGLEYKYITQYIAKELSYNEMFQQLNQAIHKFAKRQTTWFRKMQRKGTKIKWIDGNLPIKEKIDIVLSYYLIN